MTYIELETEKVSNLGVDICWNGWKKRVRNRIVCKLEKISNLPTEVSRFFPTVAEASA